METKVVNWQNPGEITFFISMAPTNDITLFFQWDALVSIYLDEESTDGAYLQFFHNTSIL